MAPAKKRWVKLLRSAEWWSALLGSHKAEFLEWLGVPKGAIFISSASPASQTRWMCFAMRYLHSQNAPVVSLRKGANRILFTESDEVEVRLLLVSHLLRDPRAKARLDDEQAERKRMVEDVIAHCKLERYFKVHLHQAVEVAFAHMDYSSRTCLDERAAVGHHLFLPTRAPLSMALLDALLDSVKRFVALFAGSTKWQESNMLINYLGKVVARGAFTAEGEPIRTPLRPTELTRLLEVARRLQQRAGEAHVPREPEPPKPPPKPPQSAAGGERARDDGSTLAAGGAEGAVASDANQPGAAAGGGEGTQPAARVRTRPDGIEEVNLLSDDDDDEEEEDAHGAAANRKDSSATATQGSQSSGSGGRCGSGRCGSDGGGSDGGDSDGSGVGERNSNGGDGGDKADDGADGGNGDGGGQGDDGQAVASAPQGTGRSREGDSTSKRTTDGEIVPPACTHAKKVGAPPKVVSRQGDKLGGNAPAEEPEHKMAGELQLREIRDATDEAHAIYVGEHDVEAFEATLEDIRAALSGFQRALADVNARTGSTLAVFPAYAPSECWLGVNMGDHESGARYALINLGKGMTAKRCKWVIVHELAHQASMAHDIPFVHEVEKLTCLLDSASDDLV